jgi:maleylpyruvate isomerase
MVKLFGYFRSSAAYRVRIALNLKNIEWQSEIIHLTKNGGEQFSEFYQNLNPQSLLPTLEDDGNYFTQSLAILEYIEEVYPDPPLLPTLPTQRAHVRSIALAVACDIHPINNLRVLKYLTQELKIDEVQKTAWYRHWISTGLGAIETMLTQHPETGKFCHGSSVSLADICLVPQVFNANRFDCDMAAYPTITRINDACISMKEFQQAMPENQPDAEE